MPFSELTNLSILLLPGFGLWLAVSIASGDDEVGKSNSANYRVMRNTARIMQLWGFIGVAAGLISPTGFALLPILLGSVLGLLIFQRRVANERLVWCLSQACDQQMDVAAVATAFESDASWQTRSRAIRLSRSIAGGNSVPAAVRQAGLRIPASMMLAMHLESRSNSGHNPLNESLEREDRYRLAVREFLESALYVWIVGTFVLLFSALIASLIVPTMMNLTREVATETQGRLRQDLGIDNLLAFWDGVQNQLAWTAPVTMEPPLSILFWGVVIISWLGAMLLMMTMYTELLPLSIFPATWLHRHFDRANVLTALGRKINERANLVDTVKMISHVHPYRRYRQRASRLSESILSGASAGDALMSAKLISARERDALIGSEIRNDTGNQLLEISDECVRRSERNWNLLARWVTPIGLIGIGILVGQLAYFLFASLCLILRALM